MTHTLVQDTIFTEIRISTSLTNTNTVTKKRLMVTQIQQSRRDMASRLSANCSSKHRGIWMFVCRVPH